MRKVFLFVMVLVLATSLASAASIFNSCGGAITIPVASFGTSQNFNCNSTGWSGTLPADAYAVYVVMSYAVDMTYDPYNTPASAHWSIASNINAANWTAGGTISDTARPVPVTYFANQDSTAADLLTFNTSTWTVTVNSTAAVGGTVDTTYNVAFFEYYQTGIPEPATLALFGGGLIALAVFGRRRRS